MFGDHLEDDFNAWVRSTGTHEFGLKLEHSKDAECWVATISHKEPKVECINCEDVISFLEYSKTKGYISRYWFEDIKDEHLFIVGKQIAFCYNG